MRLFPKVYDRKKRDREFRKKRLLQNEKANSENKESTFDKLIVVPYSSALGTNDPQTNKILIYADTLAKMYVQHGYRVGIIPAYLVDYLKLAAHQKKDDKSYTRNAIRIQQELYDEWKYFYKHCLALGILFAVPRRTYFSFNLLLACNKEHVNLLKQGFITSTYDVRNRSTTSQTALSENDIQTVEKTGNLFCVRFFVEGKKNSISATISDVIFLFGAVALAVHPADKRYKKIVGKNVLIPIINKRIPIITDACVDPTKHTGAIVLIPAHDKNHFHVAQKHGLPVNVYAIDDCGFFTCHAGQFAEKNASIFRENIIRFLSDIGNLDKVVTTHVHQCMSKATGEVLIPMAKRQWFFSLPSNYPFPADLSCIVVPAANQGRIVSLLYGTEEGEKRGEHQATKQKKIPDYLVKHVLNQQEKLHVNEEKHKQCISKYGSGIPKLPSQIVEGVVKNIDLEEVILRRKKTTKKATSTSKKQKEEKKHIYMTVVCLGLRMEGLLKTSFTLEDRYEALLRKIKSKEQKENNFFAEIDALLGQHGIEKPDWWDILQQEVWTKEQAEYIYTILEETRGIKHEEKSNTYMFDGEILGEASFCIEQEDHFDTTRLATLQTHVLIQNLINTSKKHQAKEGEIHLLSSEETLHFTSSFFQYTVANPYVKTIYIHHIEASKYVTKPLVEPRLQTTAADCIRTSLFLPYILSNENSFGTKEEFFLQKLRNATRYITSKIHRGSVTPEHFFKALKTQESTSDFPETITWMLTRWQKMLQDYEYRQKKHEVHERLSSLIQFAQYEFCDIFLEHSKQEFFEKKENEKTKETTKKKKKNTPNETNITIPQYDVLSSPFFIIISYILKQLLQHLYPLVPYVTSNLWHEGGCKEPIHLKLPYSIPETIKKNFKYALLMEILAQRKKRYTLASPRGQECVLYIQASKDFLLYTQTQEKKVQSLTKNTTIVYVPEGQNLPEHVQETKQIVDITIGYYIAPQDQKRASDVDPEVLEKELEEKEQLLQKIRFILSTIKPHEVLMKKEYEKKFEEVKKEIEQLEYEMKKAKHKKRE